MKNYAAESGLSVRYWFCGQREAGAAEEFVFEYRFGAQQPKPVTVKLLSANIGSEYTATERYAVAKLSLFKAWDDGLETAVLQPDAEEIRDHLRTIGRIE